MLVRDLFAELADVPGSSKVFFSVNGSPMDIREHWLHSFADGSKWVLVDLTPSEQQIQKLIVDEESEPVFKGCIR